MKKRTKLVLLSAIMTSFSMLILLCITNAASFADEEKEQEIEVVPEVEQETITVEQSALPTSTKVGKKLVPDETLYQYLVDVKGLSPNFTSADLANVQFIQYKDTNQQIHSLEGIQYMTNLEYLLLNNQAITSLSPMKEGYYPRMDYMEFSNFSSGGKNKIDDFSFLTNSRFPNLRRQVAFNNNQVDDIALATLPQSDRLQSAQFYFESNQITDVTPFAAYTDASRLQLHMNKIVDITPLANLQNIYALSLSNNKIKDVSALSNITYAANASLWLSNNQIADLSPLEDLDITILASTYTEGVEIYVDPNNNKGQQIVCEPIVVSMQTKEASFKAFVKDKEGNILQIPKEGNYYDTYVTTLDPNTDNEFTYQVDGSYAKTQFVANVRVPIIWWDTPVIEADDIRLYQGQQFNVLDAVVAKDYANESISVSVVDLNGFDIEKPGLYKVIYKVVDKYGYEAIKTRTIMVDGKVEFQKTPLRYTVESENLSQRLPSLASLSYLEVQSDGTLKKKQIDKEDIKVKNIETIEANTTTGVYEVEYEVSLHGNLTTHKESILLMDEQSVIHEEAQLVLSAQSFSLTQAEASALTKQQMLEKMNASAYAYDKKVSAYKSITSSIYIVEDDMQKLKNSNGGIYSLLVIAESNGDEVTRTIDVIIEGKDLIVDESNPSYKYLLSAKDIEISYSDAINSQEDVLLNKMEAKALEMYSQKPLTVSLEHNDIIALHSVNENGGVYQVKCFAKDSSGNKVIQKVVTIKVSKQNKSTVEMSSASKEADNKKSGVNTSDTSDIYMLYMMLTLSIFIIYRRIIHMK